MLSYLTTSSLASNLTWIVLAVLSYGVLALAFHLISIKEGYHGRHRVQPQPIYRITKAGAWDFGDAPTVTFYRSGRVPEWDGAACYVPGG